MGDLRSELEKITAEFVSTVLAVARTVPLRELAGETGDAPSSRKVAKSPPLERALPPMAAPTPLPRGVRGAPTALKRAVEWQRQLDTGQVRSRAAIARREGLTRARVTQIMNLLRKGR
jgi:hypothetical protein